MTNRRDRNLRHLCLKIMSTACSAPILFGFRARSPAIDVPDRYAISKLIMSVFLSNRHDLSNPHRKLRRSCTFALISFVPSPMTKGLWAGTFRSAPLDNKVIVHCFVPSHLWDVGALNSYNHQPCSLKNVYASTTTAEQSVYFVLFHCALSQLSQQPSQ